MRRKRRKGGRRKREGGRGKSGEGYGGGGREGEKEWGEERWKMKGGNSSNTCCINQTWIQLLTFHQWNSVSP